MTLNFLTIVIVHIKNVKNKTKLGISVFIPPIQYMNKISENMKLTTAIAPNIILTLNSFNAPPDRHTQGPLFINYGLNSHVGNVITERWSVTINALIVKACTDGNYIYLVLDRKLKVIDSNGNVVKEVELPRIPVDICCLDGLYMLSGPFIFTVKDGEVRSHFFRPGMKMCSITKNYLIILGKNSVHFLDKSLRLVKSLIVGDVNYVEFPFLVTSKGIQLIMGEFPIEVPTKSKPYKIFRCKTNVAIIWIENMKGVVEVLGKWKKMLDSVPIHAAWDESCKYLLLAKGWSALLFDINGKEIMEVGMESRVEWVGWLKGPLILTRERLSSYELKL